MSASSLPKRNSASDWASSVLPTPEGPRKMNDPPGRRGSLRGERERRMALATLVTASSCPTTALVKRILAAQQLGRLGLGEGWRRAVRDGGDHVGDVLLVGRMTMSLSSLARQASSSWSRLEVSSFSLSRRCAPARTPVPRRRWPSRPSRGRARRRPGRSRAGGSCDERVCERPPRR